MILKGFFFFFSPLLEVMTRPENIQIRNRVRMTEEEGGRKELKMGLKERFHLESSSRDRTGKKIYVNFSLSLSYVNNTSNTVWEAKRCPKPTTIHPSISQKKREKNSNIAKVCADKLGKKSLCGCLKLDFVTFA